MPKYSVTGLVKMFMPSGIAAASAGDERHLEQMFAGQLEGAIGYGAEDIIGDLVPGDQGFFEFNNITIIVTFDVTGFQFTVGGVVPNTDEAWETMSITGFYEGGFETKIFRREDGDYDLSTTTRWNYIQDSADDQFINGQFYDCVWTRPKS